MSVFYRWTSGTLFQRSLAVACVLGAVFVVFILGRGVIYRGQTPVYHMGTNKPTFLHHNGVNMTTPFPATDTGQRQKHIQRSPEAGQAPVNHSLNVSVSVGTELDHGAYLKSDSYLGVMSIIEQLSANIENFLQLTYMSKLWKLSMIEPVVAKNSFMFSIPPSFGSDTIPLGYLYNVTAVTKRLHKCLDMPGDFYFHSLSEALIHSSRDVLVLRFLVSKQTFIALEECDSKSESTMKEVIEALNLHVDNVKEQARAIYGDEYLFRAWKAICVKAIPKVAFSVSKLSSFLKDMIQRKKKETKTGVMVVIPEWRKVKSGMTSRHYYYDPTLSYNSTSCETSSFAHSDLVVEAAKRLLGSFHLSRPLLGVYVRTENMVLQGNEHRGFIEKCLQKFEIVLKQVKKMFNISDIALISDMGPYGSKSFTSSIIPKAHDILSKFKSWNIQSYHYEPKSFKNFPNFLSFIASVEKEFISRSDALITLGKGGFGRSVASHFRLRSSADRLFTMCSEQPEYLPNIDLSD